MRTTVAIDDNLLAHAKQRASEMRLTLGEYLESAIQIELIWGQRVEGRRPRLRTVPGGTLQPGIDPTSNSSLLGDDELDPSGLVR